MFLSDLCPKTLKFTLSFRIEGGGIGGSNQDDEVKRLIEVEIQERQSPYLPLNFVSGNGIAVSFSDVDANP